MSLTSLLDEPDVRARLRAEFPTPRVVKHPIVTPALTRNFAMVGTAFDYLLRQHILWRNPNAIQGRWVAEVAVSRLPKPWQSLGKKLVERARGEFTQFATTGELTDSALMSAIDLARLDSYLRARAGLEYLRNPYDPLDYRDLRNLLRQVPEELHRPQRVIILNPTFGEASILVGGADADLLIGDTLVDIKTISSPSPSRDDFNQLVGYAILARIGGITNTSANHEVRHIAFYLSRSGALQRNPIIPDLAKIDGPTFVSWFRQRALKHTQENRKGTSA